MMAGDEIRCVMRNKRGNKKTYGSSHCGGVGLSRKGEGERGKSIFSIRFMNHDAM